ncbi:MAG: sulfatase-like hydrolase/transferase [Candidatus Thorarchaeota archaeon]
MKDIYLIILDSVRQDFLSNSLFPELVHDFVEFSNCKSIYTSTCLSHYTIFYGNYFGKAENKCFPAQLKKLGYKVKSFCNGAIIIGYPLKTIFEENFHANAPYREDFINDLGINIEYNWNRRLFGSKLEDYYGAADDEDRNIPLKWQEYIVNNKNNKNFIFLHFWNTHHNYEINEFLENKITGKNLKELGQELIKRIIYKELTIKFTKKVYLKRIHEVSENYIRDLISLLKKNELYDDSLIIITSDHGEGLGDIGKNCPRSLVKTFKFLFETVILGFYKRLNRLKFFNYLPKLDEFLTCKWEFYTFFHSGGYNLQKEIPMFIKFPNKEFGGKICRQEVSLFDIIHTINDLLDEKILIKSSKGRSFFSLLKGGKDAIEKYKIKTTIKNLSNLILRGN